MPEQQRDTEAFELSTTAEDRGSTGLSNAVQADHPKWLMDYRLTLTALFVSVGLALCVAATSNPIASLDQFLNRLFTAHDSDWFASFARQILSAPGHFETAMALALLASVILLILRQRLAVLTFWLIPLSAGIIAAGLKDSFSRARPPTAPEMSSLAWPSGHTTMATVTAGLFLFVLLPRLRVSAPSMPRWMRELCSPKAASICFLFAVIITSAGRLLSGVHWFSDVVAGVMIGFIFVQAAILLDDILHREA
jgi:undecaprenyl-diphosphatase